MNEYLRTEKLSVGYDGQTLIRDIDLRLKKGRILVLIGPNGSGKSTILKTVTKYLSILRGAVYIGDGSLDSMGYTDLAKKAAVVLTERMKTERMTCLDVVETGRYPYTGRLGILSPEDKQKVREAMTLVRAYELADKSFMQISDGQRQRVLLARAICQEPELIVLDEPTTFLDIRYKLELMELLRMLARERNIAVMLSLHELDIAERIADDILCVKGETISHYGSVSEIFKRDLISDLYELDSGSFNPLFGSLEMAKPQGEPRLFVIAGGGAGIPVYRALQKRRIPFFTGILQENDVDYQLAKELAAETVAARAFEPIGEREYGVALDRLRSCDAVMNCLLEYGELNRINARLFDAAKKMGLQVLTLEDILSNRAF